MLAAHAYCGVSRASRRLPIATRSRLSSAAPVKAYWGASRASCRMPVSQTRLFSSAPVKEAIASKGNEIREMKAAKADSAAIKAAVDELVALKKELAALEGVEYDSGSIKNKKKTYDLIEFENG